MGKFMCEPRHMKLRESDNALNPRKIYLRAYRKIKLILGPS